MLRLLVYVCYTSSSVNNFINIIIKTSSLKNHHQNIFIIIRIQMIMVIIISAIRMGGYEVSVLLILLYV